jgi:hypothetical protein
MMKRHLLPGLISVGMAGAIGIGIGAWAGGSGSGHTVSGTLAASHARAPVTCGTFERPMGYVAVVRAGQDAAARQALRTRLLAQVSDVADHATLDFARSATGLSPAQFSARWLPVYPQARESRLRSCDMTLSDRPAAQRLINATIVSFVRAGYFRSAASARAKRQIVLLSDDPAAAGSVIVTFLVTGPRYNPPIRPGSKAGPHPPLHLLDAYTAIVNTASAAVTGVARGGF